VDRRLLAELMAFEITRDQQEQRAREELIAAGAMKLG
jgi:hypothetical protein